MPQIHLGPSDANRQVDASVGDRLVIALPESPSTGQSWFTQTSNAGIVRLEEEAFDRSGPLMPGGGGRRRFRFVAVNQGEATLLFRLAFAASDASIETLTMRIGVR
jgi:predicted secreted protein